MVTQNLTQTGTPTFAGLKITTPPFQSAQGTTDVSVGTVEADMPQMSLSVVSDGSPIRLSFWCGYRMLTDSHFTNFKLLRDTTLVRGWAHHPHVIGESEETSIVWVDTPAAATYTYKIRWSAQTNTSERDAATNGNFEGSILIAEVMKR